MASSMLTGERRWVSARRGGMTVLGKVTVPKPVNLPSQRLENHGLDPNVEIVPKGTLSWGTRSSSSAPNAWGSSALSPSNTDGGAGSPSRLSGRPSSGGSGTRPSTAGSDRSQEPASNVWGLNSRPSSASGVFASKQTSMATTRPRSAETRPGSSQLSRFAEPTSENSAAWGASGTAEKLGVGSSKINGFTMSSGDFPTLGSEKSIESHERQGHSSEGRPSSASGRIATAKVSTGTSPTEDDSVDANAERTVNILKDSSPYDGDGAPPIAEKWRRESQLYPNASMPRQHFDPWHGPVRHSPDVVWYGGPPGGPPYGTPGPPGSYPVEPFTYYHPQIPARALANSQSVPHSGAGPRGRHLKNDLYRPQMNDSYIRPVMPVRPGAYRGPVPYEGYYGPPPVGFCNFNERDAPVMGMAAGPCVYNRYPNPNVHPDSSNFHGYDSASSTMAKEQVESGYPHDTRRGPYKVLLKQRNGWDENDGEENMEHTVTINASYIERAEQSRTSIGETDWEADHRKDEVDFPKTAFGGEASPQPADSWGDCSSVPVGMNLPEGRSNATSVDDSLVKKPQTVAIPREVPQVFPAIKRNPNLIHKIEGLNSKARISDGRYDMGHVSYREEQVKQFRVVNAKADHSTDKVSTGAVSVERACTSRELTPVSHEVGASRGKKSLEPTHASAAVVSMSVCELQASTGSVLVSSEVDGKAHSQIHKRVHDVQGRVDYRGKGRFIAQESEEWRKKSIVADSTSVVPVANVETCLNVHVQNNHASKEALENSDCQGKTGGPYISSSSDQSDYKAQRAKMREIRAKVQKEEEERTREQKAKAQAKLEELDRRKLAEGSTLKLDQDLPPGGAIENKQEESWSHAAPTTDTISFGALSSALVLSSDSIAQPSENSSNRVGKSTDFARDLPLEDTKCAPQGNVVSENSFLPLQKGVNSVDASDCKTAPQVHYGSVSKQNHISHKRKQNIPLKKHMSERLIPTATCGAPKCHADVTVSTSADVAANVVTLSGESSLASNPNIMDDSLLHHKKKSNRNAKNKHKLEESSSGAALPLVVPTHGNPAKDSSEDCKSKASKCVLEVSSVHALTSRETADAQDSEDTVPFADQWCSLPTEEAHAIVNNQWKPQLPRRMPRNSQATRSTEKFHCSETVVWAPVRSQNKTDASEEASHNIILEANSPLVKNGHGVQNSLKSKRAEMERYIPKPVAKELAQLGNTQRPSSPSTNQATSAETTGKESASLSTESSGPDGLAVGKAGFSLESKNGESRQNKHGKAQGSWRQRSTGLPHIQGSQEGSSFPLDLSKNVQKPAEQHRPLKPETHSPKGQTKYSDNWNIPNNPASTELVVGSDFVKEHRLTDRGKRHPFKGHKGTGHNYNPVDQKDVHSGDTSETEAHSSALELSQSEGRVALRANRGVGEHATSHWQPKSQAYAVHSRQGSRASGVQRVASEVGTTTEREVPPKGGEHLPLQNDKATNVALVHPHLHQSKTQKTKVAEVPNVQHQDVKRERKSASFNERPHPPNQGHVNLAELAPPANVGTQHEQPSSSGFRKNGHQNSRFDRGNEVPREDWSPPGQDYSKKHLPANRDRRRPNPHYEYQPIGSYDNKQNNSFEGPMDGSAGSRYRERGQNHSRRGGGNSYGQHGVASSMKFIWIWKLKPREYESRKELQLLPAMNRMTLRQP
ncbi:hypothetical protein HHK36_024984 [Tetracentron sinense]|uniref:BAT2 N-terminal domain-containing protein n=1 Tax=Tetracentron sinense TaxID=13715 RepID=A0A834YQ22_TETSI|nr:hypothetical protein HHK36_024984 [Tetracentron sinense]